MHKQSNSKHERGPLSRLSDSGITRGLALVALLCLSSAATWAQNYSPCDLNSDGVVDNTDVNLAVNMAVGTASCAANVEGPLTCTIITVQRVFNASQGQPCMTYNSHSVTLNWVASTATNITGYKAYRGTASGGPYTLVSSSIVTALTFTDLNVAAGQSYFYVVTAVDNSGNESGYSNEAQGTVPSP